MKRWNKSKNELLTILCKNLAKKNKKVEFISDDDDDVKDDDLLFSNQHWFLTTLDKVEIVLLNLD